MAQVIWIIWHIVLVILLITDQKSCLKSGSPKRTASKPVIAQAIVSLLVIAAVIYIRLHCTADSFTIMADIMNKNPPVTILLMIVICGICRKLQNASTI